MNHGNKPRQTEGIATVDKDQARTRLQEKLRNDQEIVNFIYLRLLLRPEESAVGSALVVSQEDGVMDVHDFILRGDKWEELS